MPAALSQNPVGLSRLLQRRSPRARRRGRHPGRQCDQIDEIASFEGKVDHLLLLDRVFDRGRFHLQQAGRHAHGQGFALFSEFQGERLAKTIAGVHFDVGLRNLLESLQTHRQVVLPDGKLCQQVFAGTVRLGRIFQVRAGLDSRDGGVGDDGARRVPDDPIDFSRVHLTERGRRAEQ